MSYVNNTANPNYTTKTSSDTGNTYSFYDDIYHTFTISNIYNDTKAKITDVEILQEDKVIRVTFSDGDKQKAVCNELDTFSLERGIEVCIGKHLLGGTSQFNKAIKDGIKVYEDKLQAIKDKKAEEERIEKKRQKHNAYRDRCRQKAEQAEKEKQIEIQKEAYLQAMKEFNGGKKTKKQKS